MGHQTVKGTAARPVPHLPVGSCRSRKQARGSRTDPENRLN